MSWTQEELESKARWYAGAGCVFTEDFIRKHVGADRMKAVDLTGAYVYRAEKPVPCIYVHFGAGGSWIPDLPITKHLTVSRTEAECSRMGWFMMRLDPENKYRVRAWHYHVDLSAVKLVRRPSDEEIAELHLKYRDAKQKHGKKQMAAKRVRPDDRLQRELRALDRRRFRDASILPPPNRAGQPGYIDTIGNEPRAETVLDKPRLDEYHSDSSDGLFGSDDDGPSLTRSSPAKRSAISGSDETPLEIVLRGMRAMYPPKPPPI